MAIKLVNLPPTEFGAKLDFNSNEDLRVVYRPSEQVPDSYEFHDLWYPEQNYPDGYVAVPFESVFVYAAPTARTARTNCPPSPPTAHDRCPEDQEYDILEVAR